MNEYSIEKQICTLDQAEKLKKYLGDDAPESLWCFVYGRWGVNETNPQWNTVLGKPQIPSTKFYYAYSGDELGALLPPLAGKIMNPLHTHKIAGAHGTLNFYCAWGRSKIGEYQKTEAQAKADLAIQGLKKGWIKPEDFSYD